jgi:hypothetical protein
VLGDLIDICLPTALHTLAAGLPLRDNALPTMMCVGSVTDETLAVDPERFGRLDVDVITRIEAVGGDGRRGTTSGTGNRTLAER